jgi:hypothetical protein
MFWVLWFRLWEVGRCKHTDAQPASCMRMVPRCACKTYNVSDISSRKHLVRRGS